MNNYRISDHDASGLVSGRGPAGSPELGSLAKAIADFRRVSLAGSASPQPSAALADLLSGAASAPVRASGARTARSTRPQRLVGGLLGLGVGVKIVLGVALGAAAVTGAGFAGVLPGGAQHVFDQIASNVTPHAKTPVVGGTPGISSGSTSDPSKEPAATPAPQSTANFGSQVSDRAQTKQSGGDNAFGQETSQLAHEKKTVESTVPTAVPAPEGKAGVDKISSGPVGTDVKDAIKGTGTPLKGLGAGNGD